tara:strand:+ start:2195 stop:4234 length:2040 start_codon:yes stop_codon:yes gene_type:complete
MAETKTVKLKVESNVDEVTAEFKKTGAAINTATEDVNKFNTATVKGADDVVKSQKKVQDSLKDTARQSKKATDGFKEFKGAADGVKTGFETAEGAMELFGSSSEATGEAVKKVGQVMQLSDGIKGLKAGAGAWKVFGTSAITALRGMSKALIATGIGALVVGVGLLVAYWDDIKDALGGVSSEQEKINELNESNLKLAEDNLSAISDQENVLKLQGKSEKEILKLKLAAIDSVIEETKATIEQAKIEAKADYDRLQRNQEIAKTIAKVTLNIATGLLRIFTLPIDAIIVTINKASSLLGLGEAITSTLGGVLDDVIEKGAEAAASFMFDPEAAQKAANEQIAEQEKGLQKLENNQAGFKLSIQKIDQNAANQAVKTVQEKNALILKAEEDLNKSLEKLRNDLLDELAALDQENYDKTQTEQELEERKAREKYFRLKTLAKNEIEDETAQKEALEIIETNHLNAMNDIALKYGAEADAAKLLRDAKTKTKDDKDAADKLKNFEIFEESKAKIRDQAIENVEAGLNLVKMLAGENKKVQAAAIIGENAISVAKIINNTQAANAAVRTKYALLPGGAVPAAAEILSNKISAGIGIATAGVATVKGLSALKESGTVETGDLGDDGGGGGGGGDVISPEFNIVGDSGINDLEGIGQPPLQAYVTSQDVTSAQGLDRARIENATI